MRESTIQTIQAIATADPESTPEQVKNILAACKTPVARRKLVLAKEAMQILGVSRPTLRNLTRAGQLTEIKPTPRKTRFDLTEVERLAFCGAKAVAR